MDAHSAAVPALFVSFGGGEDNDDDDADDVVANVDDAGRSGSGGGDAGIADVFANCSFVGPTHRLRCRRSHVADALWRWFARAGVALRRARDTGTGGAAVACDVRSLLFRPPTTGIEHICCAADDDAVTVAATSALVATGGDGGDCDNGDSRGNDGDGDYNRKGDGDGDFNRKDDDAAAVGDDCYAVYGGDGRLYDATVIGVVTPTQATLQTASTPDAATSHVHSRACACYLSLCQLRVRWHVDDTESTLPSHAVILKRKFSNNCD
jgi:hypothetical protein